MNVPINLFMWSMACLPIVVLLVLMIKFQWGATEAAPIGLLITVFTGLAFYKADIKLLASESAKGIWSALVVLIIVWTAILLYEVANEAKAFLVIRNGMQKLLPNELLLVIAMGWVFESFLQGITGFGVAVAVGAPLLVGIGVLPLWAVIIPLIGHAWGNTFGTLAVAWDALTMSAGLEPGTELYLQTALWAAIFIWVWNVITGLAICWFYGKGKALKKGLPAVLIISLIQGGGQLILTQINTTIACFIPACISLVVLFVLGRTKIYKDKWSVEDSRIMNREFTEDNSDKSTQNMSLVQAFFPYAILTVITLVVLLIAPIKAFLGQFSFGLAFPETSTAYGFVNEASASFSPLSPFTHASMFLLIASLVGLLYFRKHGWIKAGGCRAVFVQSIQKTVPSGIAVIGFIIMSKIMGGTGQTMVLANGIANVLGTGYAVLAPVVGMLGAFMTSSNMASNILFGEFQITTANLLGLKTAAILGAQTAGGAIGNTICPGNIILGTTTAKILGKEGLVLKKIMPITLSAAILVGIILFFTIIFA
ncbi:lactate permease [Lachnotalea glycerini]|jgi:lactate permease|uniref:L-lactate permease n=1 Tax=Lachnotalea glycerini TaxID=1763509 RepID=A0A318F0C7_9FIRM|nr:L-lactate permease [Lachnotalea glycerini]PXV93824.1 lactate permease [Lachnotalea glycerini]